MNKCTLLVDGNWLLMSRFGMNREGFLKENSDFEKNIALNNCVNDMKLSLSYILEKLEGLIENIILICDGQSWRKKVPKPKSLEAEYKGTRVRDEDLDWDYIYKALIVLEDDMRTLGFTVSHTHNAEGDDAIWYWKTRLNKERKNCLIWTSDYDLKQLVSYENGVFTAWYNDRYGMFFDSKMNFTGDDIDLFMADSANSKSNLIIESFVNKSEAPLGYINPEDIVMEKIICGDKSDNIKSVVRIVKGGKTYSVTPKMWTEAKEKLGIETLNDFFASQDTIISELRKIKKFQDTNLKVEDCNEQFEYNTKLVWLDETVIPENVQKEFESVIYFENPDLDYIRIKKEENSEEAESLLPF